MRRATPSEPTLRHVATHHGVSSLSSGSRCDIVLHDAPAGTLVAATNYPEQAFFRVFLRGGARLHRSSGGMPSETLDFVAGDVAVTPRGPAPAVEMLGPTHALHIGVPRVLLPGDPDRFYGPSVRVAQLMHRLVPAAQAGRADPAWIDQMALDLPIAFDLDRGRKGVCMRPLPPEVARSLREQIRDELSTTHSVSSLARPLGLSASRLNQAFRATFGTSVYDYILQLRLERAAQLISCSTLSLTAVALDVGFYDHAHFTKAFRRRFGINPTELRTKPSAKTREIADDARADGHSVDDGA